MAATLECGKLALAAIPNFEVVTLLCGIYGYVFGPLGILASLVFVAIEPLIWGFGTWIISYIIYWPLVSVVFFILSRLRVRSRISLTATALILTLFFGVLTSLVDVGLFSGSYENFFYRFSVYYARGIVFYAIQLGANALLFSLLFPYLSSQLTRVKSKMKRK